MAGAPVIGGQDSRQAVDDLVEQVCLHVRQSAAVQEARLDSFLDGAILAAEQVQDVRIAVLEQPAELEGWKFWLDIAITLALESNLAGKLVNQLTKALFTPVVRSNALFLLLPKSPAGQDLVKVAKARSIPRRKGASPRYTFDSVLKEGTRKLPGTASKESLKLYGASVQAFVNWTADLDLGNAVAQAANKARESGRPRRNDPLVVTNSAGVNILTQAQDYARASQLGVRIRHARFEAFVRGEAALPDLATIVEGVDWQALPREDSSETLGPSLAELRSKYALLLEALIWARLHGFALKNPQNRAGAGVPRLAASEEQPYPDVNRQLQDYWFSRFRQPVAAFVQERGGQLSPGRTEMAIRLRQYLAALSLETQKLGLGRDELQAAVPSP
jgi:hypothetical protein